ncbi:hypothetical protein SEA_ZIMMER_70 [Mycobacterium phage Zimmer]|nr:hypothetical protein SEA_ZIMMER_70 [Mycobacterium phage Zimmer]
MIVKRTVFHVDKEKDEVTICPPAGARVILRSENGSDKQTIIIRPAWRPGDEL